jgi:hypothetical protein
MKEVVVVKQFGILAVLLAFLVVLPAVHADEWNQATLITFSQPVQIPGRVLPAGTYLFELVNNYNHEIVRISNADRSNVIALVQAIPAKQAGFSGNGAVILAQRGESKPEAVVAWSYPGQLQGHQFLYEKRVQSDLARDKKETIAVGD